MATMFRTDRAAWALAGALLAALPAGCANVDPSAGYTTASQYPRDVRTVAVPIFVRGAGEFRRDFEIRLTEAVKKRITMDTRYRLTDPSRADTLLLGTLNWIQQRPLSYDTREGRPREYQVRVSVDLLWKDLRGTGRIRVERKDFRV
ncbi:MAG TPA: LPS assembly lipoprotein LptE, partial [Phycisphaerae bacterium]|nr:LPS assembly lipoprotein LptE [Phycisphaerae bacterium]